MSKMGNNQSAGNSPRMLFLIKYWHIFALTGIAVLSFWFNFYAISKTGYGNAYYAAAIRSMTQSFKNFFFVSFDPAGVVSVDKPPLALWVQTLFVLIFGYHGWVMLLPQALAGTGSCIMMYLLTAKYFGRAAGLISTLVFAITPAAVVASRNNTMDMQLIFVLLIATWFLFQSIETTKWRYLFVSDLFVGLGFNIKMLQAYMVLPAIGIVYLFFSKEKVSRRILAGMISIVIIAVVSFSWVIAVDLYPSSERPYVGSSTNNTMAELIVGHNGLERIYGGGGGIGGRGNQNGQGGPQGMSGQRRGNQPPQAGQQNGNNGTVKAPANQSSNRNPGTGQGNGQTGGFGGRQDGQGGRFNAQGGGRGGAGNDIGTAGVLRLWGSSMYGQATWLIVFALFCIVVKLRKFNLKQLTLKQGIFLFWIIWLAAMLAFFSFASFYHRYYLCMLAPGIAGLVGIGFVDLYQAFRDKHGWKQWLFPLSLLATFAVETVYVWMYSALRAWLAPVMIIAASFSLLLMVVHYVTSKRFTLLAAAGFMLVSILAGPFYWSLTTVMYVPENVTMPYAGPELASQTKTQGMTPNQETFTSTDSQTLALEKYLTVHYKTGSYLVVSQQANDVAAFIVDTGLPAVAYGGFMGTDQSMTLDRLKQLVKEGKVTYFLVSKQSGFGGNSEITSYVKANAALINPSEYGGTESGSSGSSLYYFES
jgi:4-amino-4-deoxy-L-arabinose transferase-like glycosyltransferase